LINAYQCIESKIKALPETLTRYLAPARISHQIDIEMALQPNILPFGHILVWQNAVTAPPCGLSRRRADCHLCGAFEIRANYQEHKQRVNSSF
jgi:hypothetical protein